MKKRMISALIMGTCILSMTGFANNDQINQNVSAVEVEGLNTDAGGSMGTGQLVLNAIKQAKQSIDISIYDLNGETINAALVDALSRGVNVRIIFNGNYSGTTHEANVKDVEAQLKAAKPGPGGKLGTYSLHWSSNNFQITHSKYVVIDAVDQNGQPLQTLPSSATLIISTGNMSDYESTPWYNARDFELQVQNPDAIVQAENVFYSDFNCDGVNVTNNLLNSSPLVWSNGTTGANASDPADAYPTSSEGYPYEDKLSANATIQGGARNTMYNIINSAQSGDTINFYNEEISDDSASAQNINNALLAALKKHVTVDIIMASSAYSQYSFKTQLDEMAKAGADIHLIDESDSQPYIHAKVVSLLPASGHNIPASQPSMYVGSTNDSGPSMDMNRELGIALNSGDQSAINTINDQFAYDWQMPHETPSSSAAHISAEQSHLSQEVSENLKLASQSGSFTTQTCGPINI
ncbi:phospholipase D-like domain-containing protein [Francisellaceae bacterium]|nr:phospholipase D-like domain-containing protein [Francisellaceae bacterium]